MHHQLRQKNDELQLLLARGQAKENSPFEAELARLRDAEVADLKGRIQQLQDEVWVIDVVLCVFLFVVLCLV